MVGLVGGALDVWVEHDGEPVQRCVETCIERVISALVAYPLMLAKTDELCDCVVAGQARGDNGRWGACRPSLYLAGCVGQLILRGIG